MQLQRLMRGPNRQKIKMSPKHWFGHEMKKKNRLQKLTHKLINIKNKSWRGQKPTHKGMKKKPIFF